MRREPKVIIEALKRNNGAVRQTARELGISPGTVMFWRTRARSLSNLKYLRTKGLARKSTRPKHFRSTALSGADKARIRAIREETKRCAHKLRYWLKLSQSVSTVHRFLKQAGYVTERYRRRPMGQPTIHMHVKNATTVGKLQMDVKYVTPELSGLPHTLFLYAVIDIYSRWKQGVILPLLDQGLSIEALKLCLPLLPFQPDFVQTDNGLEFQKRFDEFVTKQLKWNHHYIHKSTPNENAVIERSFRTDEEEFFFWQLKRPRDEVELNVQYQKYLNWYNTERPHLGINLQTPQEKIQGCSICV